MMDREPPDELTPKVRKDFCKRVKDGMLVEHAAADLLVSEELLEDWLSRADGVESHAVTVPATSWTSSAGVVIQSALITWV